MGYRLYLYQVEKAFVEKTRECKTHDEFVKLCKNYFPDKDNIVNEFEDEDECDYVSLWEIGKEIFEFGKNYENYEEICEHGSSLFSNRDIEEYYEDHDHLVLTEEGLLCAIEWQKNKIISMYKDLMREKSEDKFNKMTQEQRFKMHASDYLSWWEHGFVLDLKKSKPNVSASWLYEHTIFDLVRIYKTFDWNKYCLMLIGW